MSAPSLLCSVLCSLALWSAQAQAEPTARPRLLEQYTHTAWGAIENGPVDVLALAQGADGWLWLASSTGLFRFDGKRYERLDSVEGHSLLSSNVMALYAPPEGGLWVGYRMGGGVSYFHHGQVQHYTESQGLPGGTVSHIARAPDGSVWAATRDGLARLAAGARRFEAIGAGAGLPSRRARQILFDRNGRLWVAMQGGIYSRAGADASFRPAWPRGDLANLVEAPDGAVWAGDTVDSYYKMTPDAAPGKPAAQPALQGNNLHFDRDGGMWLFRTGGVERRAAGHLNEPGQVLTPEHGLSGGLPQSFLQDREGNVWIGTAAGVDRFRRNRLQALPLSADFDHPAIAPRPGGVWAGERVGPLRALSADGRRGQPLKQAVSALYRDPDGVLWAGNQNEVWRMGGNSNSQPAAHYRLPPEAQGYEVQAMARARDGGLWVSVVRAGLYLLKNGIWTVNGALPGLPGHFPHALASGADRVVWAGYIRNRIARIDGQRVTLFNGDQGLETGPVLSLHQHDGQLWAGGERGVAWFDGKRFTMLRGRRGEPFRGVSGIARTSGGELWLFGADGLSRIDPAELARFKQQPDYEVDFERFDAHDGLTGAASQLRPMPSMVQSDDGLLWLATANQISWIDPSHIVRNRVPPPVMVLGVAVGDRHYAPLPGLVLPKSANSLRIDFTALSLSIPERVRFRYRLDGVDLDWQDPGTRRQAFYTNLEAGSYRFRVMAANEDGVWNEREAGLDFTIPPTFAQTAWFKALCALVLAVVLSLLYRLRVRQVTRQLQQRIEARADERERIARALHDTFLQSVQGLMLRFQTLLKRLPSDGEARPLAEKILNQADQVLIEGRNQVSGLRSLHRYATDLQRMFGELGQSLREEHAAGFALIVTGQPARLHEAAGEHLYGIGREALLNAFRHANAERIELELGYGDDELTLQVRDNGGGMDPQVRRSGARPGHWGLTGMRERAAQIGAELEFWSHPGMGTAVRLKAPAARVYSNKRRPGALRRVQEWLLRDAA
jgi:signal transduction histidine kinase/ligand-binding sensor domain-containing protein